MATTTDAQPQCESRRPQRILAYRCDKEAGHNGHHCHLTGSTLYSWQNILTDAAVSDEEADA